MKRGVDQHIKCQDPVKRALNLHHYSPSSGEMVGLIQTFSAQLQQSKASLQCVEKHIYVFRTLVVFRVTFI